MRSQYEAKYEEDFIEDIKSAVVNKKWDIISTDLYDRSKYNLHVNSNYIIKYTGHYSPDVLITGLVGFVADFMNDIWEPRQLKCIPELNWISL